MTNISEYLIVVITCWRARGEETLYLMNNSISEEGFLVFSVTCTGKAQEEITSDTSFILINQYCWNHINVKLTNQINALDKKVIIYTHIGDNGILCNTITINNIRCVPFHHWDGNGEPLKDFFVTLNNEHSKFKNALEKLIQDTLKNRPTPHLIALSILCKGYLAAHGDDNSIKELSEELKKEVQDLIKGLPDELRKKVQTEDNKNKTKNKSWWITVIDKTEICRELEGITDTKDCGEGSAINALITNIFNNGISVEVKKVAAAFSALKSILQGKS